MPRGCGHCAPLLLAALVLDAAGLALVLVGAVGRPTRAGRPFGDCLVLSGALLLFVSLLGWLLWHAGNVRAEPPPPAPFRCPAPASLELSVAEPPAHPPHRNRLPREVTESPSLADLKKRVEEALRDTVWTGTVVMGLRLDSMILKVFSNHYDSKSGRFDVFQVNGK